MASVDSEWHMSVENWYNGTDRGKPKQWERNLFQCHFVHHKFYVEYFRKDGRQAKNRPIPGNHLDTAQRGRHLKIFRCSLHPISSVFTASYTRNVTDIKSSSFVNIRLFKTAIKLAKCVGRSQCLYQEPSIPTGTLYFLVLQTSFISRRNE
jgi:hypothetical protein